MLPTEVVPFFKAWLAGRQPSAPLWPTIDNKCTAAMLRADLKRAEIPLRDDEGRIVDFHALRATCSTWLALRGVPPQQHQRILRHHDFKTTMKHYTHLEVTDLAATIDAKIRYPRCALVAPTCNFSGSETVSGGADTPPTSEGERRTQHHAPSAVARRKTRVRATAGKRPGRDSNPRITDLQSVPLGHLGTRPGASHLGKRSGMRQTAHRRNPDNGSG